MISQCNETMCNILIKPSNAIALFEHRSLQTACTQQQPIPAIHDLCRSATASQLFSTLDTVIIFLHSHFHVQNNVRILTCELIIMNQITNSITKKSLESRKNVNQNRQQ